MNSRLNALDRRGLHGDDLGSGRDLCELGLDALPAISPTSGA
jgi:hypothetical protein